MFENEFLTKAQKNIYCKSEMKLETLNFIWEIKNFSKISRPAISSGDFPGERSENKWYLHLCHTKTLRIYLSYDKDLESVEFQCSILDLNKKVFNTCKKFINSYKTSSNNI